MFQQVGISVNFSLFFNQKKSSDLHKISQFLKREKYEKILFLDKIKICIENIM